MTHTIRRRFIPNNLGEIIKAERMTQEQFAARIGRHQSYIARIVRGEILPTVPTIWRITKALGYDFDEIWPAHPAYFVRTDGTPAVKEEDATHA